MACQYSCENLFHIKSGRIEATLSPRGAELLYLHRTNGTDVMWPGGIWKGTAPTVFPILGGVPDDMYTFNGSTYRMQKMVLPALLFLCLLFMNRIELFLN